VGTVTGDGLRSSCSVTRSSRHDTSRACRTSAVRRHPSLRAGCPWLGIRTMPSMSPLFLVHRSLAYSALACSRIGMSRSASFQRARDSSSRRAQTRQGAGHRGHSSGADSERGPDLRGFWQGPPDLAVEVLSPEDRPSDCLAKVDEYLLSGAPGSTSDVSAPISLLSRTSVCAVAVRQGGHKASTLPKTASVVAVSAHGSALRHRVCVRTGDDVVTAAVMDGAISASSISRRAVPMSGRRRLRSFSRQRRNSR
jgi:hypothetical protein